MQANVKTLSVRLGVKRVFWACIVLLELAYAGAIGLGVLSQVRQAFDLCSPCYTRTPTHACCQLSPCATVLLTVHVHSRAGLLVVLLHETPNATVCRSGGVELLQSEYTFYLEHFSCGMLSRWTYTIPNPSPLLTCLYGSYFIQSIC